MPTVTLERGPDGKLEGVSEADRGAWARFRALVDGLMPGASISFSWRVPRSPQHHRMVFALFGKLLEAQEQFADVDQLRAWITVGAGYADFVPGPTGRMVALPRSLAWHKMDEHEFRDFHARAVEFLLSRHATAFLWPHLDPRAQAEAMDAALREFRE